jgi:hypothetical protein
MGLLEKDGKLAFKTYKRLIYRKNSYPIHLNCRNTVPGMRLTVFWKVEGPAVPVYIIKACEEAVVQLYSFLTSALVLRSAQFHATVVLPPAKSLCPLYRRLVLPQNRSGLLKETHVPWPGNKPRLLGCTSRSLAAVLTAIYRLPLSVIIWVITPWYRSDYVRLLWTAVASSEASII